MTHCKRLFIMLTMLIGVANFQFFSFNFQLSTVSAQIIIGGNVYGGGNEGDTGGNTTVTVRAAEINHVFGGARMANVAGSAFVNIDGENADGEIRVKAVYGGNDISGTVGTGISLGATGVDKVPAELTDVIRGTETEEEKKVLNAIDNSWSAFVRTSKMATEDGEHRIVIGSLFGGGNGDYTYDSENDVPSAGKTTHYIKDKVTGAVIVQKVTDTGEAGFTEPELAKAYIELNGGCVAHVYGGGNMATVTNNTVISMNNTSKGLAEVRPTQQSGESDEDYAARLTRSFLELAAYMGLSTFQSDISSLNYTSSRVFGGNNKATMAIHPHWNLRNGKIRDLYSGGNEGDMTYQQGLLLEIKEGSNISVVNVYGGCRKANVHPLYGNGNEVPASQVQLLDDEGHPDPNYHIPDGLSARVIVSGGDITNVYGGNDITGRVWGGTAIGIRTSIRGDVYGGGNGSYAYTDNPNLKDDPNYGDFYYEVPAGVESVDALNAFRPHVEQTSLRLWGKDRDHLTIIGGSVFVGGNSATVIENTSITKPIIELKMGSNVIAENVFLGNNGANMVDATANGVLELYKGSVTVNGTSYDYSQMDLTDPVTFDKYMDGCAMSLHPHIVFDNTENGDPDTYTPYSSVIGSLYCGGNVGSMTWPGTATINVEHKLIIYDKFVAGCNYAYAPARTNLNAVYWGGITGPKSNGVIQDNVTTGGTINDAVILNLSGLKIQPMRWVTKRDASYEPILSDGKPTYLATDGCELSTINSVCSHGKQAHLEWHTINVTTGKDVANPAELATGATRKSTTDDINRRLKGGNIYGGCYSAGIVNGNVVINVNETIMDRDNVFANVEEDNEGEGILYANDEYNITKVNSGVIIDEQGMDVLGRAMNIFGGGFGADTEIWGSATINLKEGYVFQVFGGAEKGVIGKPEVITGASITQYQTTTDPDGTYDPATGIYAFNGYLYKADERYSTYVNLDGGSSGVSRHSTDDTPEMAETEFIYGGAFEGPIMGSAIVHLGNGRIFNSFAGSCNADIMGHTETYVGVNAQGQLAFPFIRDHIYGGNDLGGRILGEKDFIDRVREDVAGIKDNIYDKDNSTKAAAYTEYQQGRVDYIFGGCYGTYDYKDPLYNAYFYSTASGVSSEKYGWSRKGHTKPRLGNAFVNFRPVVSNNPLNKAKRIYGAGQGISTKMGDYGIDSMQTRSYVLIDIPAASTEFSDLTVFGAGQNGGLGMGVAPATATADPDAVSAVVDLFRGDISNANVYGGSHEEGVTRRTVVNVPSISTIQVKNIFGGAFGIANDVPCDVYEAHVNYSSSTAMVGGYQAGIYGGNNNYRRTIHGIVNINAPVWSDIEKGWLATVYGAGLGADTWSQYTEVNLNNGARVNEVYGGGSQGRVLNMESYKTWTITDPTIYTKIGAGYDDWTMDDNLVKINGLDMRCNTNVYINKGATVSGYMYNGSLSGGYAYGAGFGTSATVSGTSYIGLHGGYVAKDMYGSGWGGSVYDQYKAERATYNATAAAADKIADFTAGTNVFVEGGKVRRPYGGGYQGNVGYTELPFTVEDSQISSVPTLLANDAPAYTNVVIGIPESQKETINAVHAADNTKPSYGFYKGVPAVEWNAYGGGEKGGIIGTTHLTMYNGYVGYRYLGSDAVITGEDVAHNDDNATTIDERYIEKINDETAANGGIGNLQEHGNLFGSGFDDGSYADNTEVSVYGGYIRNSVYGGGEIAAVGRGETKESGTDNSVRELKGIWKGGTTKVSIFSGHILQNVFGGGKGFTAERGEQYGIGSVRRYTDGYVFGQAEANIHGGEIGTEEGIARGYGNVFGGGNIGYVYSSIGKKDTDGFYYLYENGAYVTDPSTHEKILTEDTKVVVAPYSLVTADGGVTVNGHTYAKGEYVTNEDLNTIATKGDAIWNKMDTESGIVIHNAVFAGGNVTQGSDLLYAQATTVFGNSTASLVDVFSRDFITLGEDGVGGLYGDGNLTFVDGYRELNITNFGTDYYGLSEAITYAQYLALNDRERAYFKLTYLCTEAYTDNNHITHNVNDEIDDEVYERLSDQDKAHWAVNQGVCSIYAGRMMNTIQRADFCGVFGSRLVMKGALDRIPSEVDYTKYTINRVGEVSLNQKSVSTYNHGNYFGIYNITKYLGALTSDVSFESTRKYKSGNDIFNDPDGKTYYSYKLGLQGNRNRNVAHSENELAMASGVYLELLQEPSRNYVGDEKVWGPITGVIGLKLISVSTGEGGGYVYAKNIHGTKSASGLHHLTISTANTGAVTKNSYKYEKSTSSQWMESSGNFVIDSPLSIIDDCFPASNKFYPEYGTTGGDDTSPAHFWYIRGYYYIYNQEISAYTGSSQAYTETVNIPLTITAQGNGKLWIEDIKTNLYADAARFPFKEGSTTERETEVICRGTTYRSNDPITYWEWSNLSASEQAYFVNKSYVCVMDVYATADDAENNVAPVHKAGEVLAGETAYNTLSAQSWFDAKGETLAGTKAFRVTNDLTHSKGFELAVTLDNPAIWDEYFTDPATGVTVPKASKDGDDLLGPTFKLNGTNNSYVFGQKEYILGDLVEEGIVYNYENGLSTTAKDNIDTSVYPQADFEPAYLALEECYITVNTDQSVHVVKNGAIPESYYNQLSNEAKTNFEEAHILTTTVQLTDQHLLSAGVLFTADEVSSYLTNYPDKVTSAEFPRAYYCSTAGYYSGIEFSSGQSYQAVQYSGLKANERSNFTYNYDALDIMLDETFAGNTTTPANIAIYDKDPASNPIYSGKQYVDYSVIYTGSASSLTTTTGGSFAVANGSEYTREQYESLLNEKQYYTPISLNFSQNATQEVYVVREEIGQGGRIYTPGTTLTASEFALLSDDKKPKVDLITFYKSTGGNVDVQTYYYCTEDYTTRTAVTPAGESTAIAVGGTVPKGTLILGSEYADLPNNQKDFNVVANSPQEKSALYVSSDCDIYDFSQDRIFTVIYRYAYTEKDEQGNSIESISERHVLNIRVHFESGEPTISELLPPATILPGSTVGLNVPSVSEGAFTVLGGGWELYQNVNDANAHKNGVPYTNYTTPMYWYQNDWYVAYYAETYLGRTFSNAVPFTIANYHDIDNVMNDKEHHLYVDHPNVKRDSKIYINNGSCSSDNTKSKLDLLSDFFQLTLHNTMDANGNPVTISDGSVVDGHKTLNSRVNGGQYLDFILNSNVAPKAYTTWTPIGDATNCFGGRLHGDGYTISGLSNSLFGNLCGSVYNLGVTGNFTTAGIADTGVGYIENAWISTTGTPDTGVRAVFNNPSRTDASKPIQLVNCYYPADNAYDETHSEHGDAIKKPRKSFNNGEVAYDLNGFYLAKRYADSPNSGITTNKYSYYTITDNANNTLSTTPSDGYYRDTYAIYPHFRNNTKYLGYVESRYIDGDFIYSGGSIPTDINERYDADEDCYYPIWPDDYIYFGQMLTYGYYEANRPYQYTPSRITKSDRSASEGKKGATAWLVTGTNSNRVYRAPAYFRNSIMDVAHFNAFAMVPAKSTDETGARSAYPGMTAIDFTGYNDNSFVEGWSDGLFNKKVLDIETLTGFRSDGQTQNLLAYAPESNTNVTGILNTYFSDRAFTLIDNEYKNVGAVSAADMNSVKGHLVYKDDNNNFITKSDHLLVDRQDFNAPIAYTLGSNKRMWYQRRPDNYAVRQSGWEAISLPYSAELVTTQDKGELTHFYKKGDDNSFNEGYDTGHEYWLREYRGIEKTENDIATATMAYPNKVAGSEKEYYNTFLYDYYYQYTSNPRKDENKDEYQQNYYANYHTYSDYPYSVAAKPYIIGFPGSIYYEFDLSGSFEAQHTDAPVPTKLPRQVITLASFEGATIAKSDNELASGKVTASGYAFVPNYLNTEVEANTSYLLNSNAATLPGSSFDATATAATVAAFRPYFTKTSSGGSKAYRTIVFNDPSATEFKVDENINLSNHGDDVHISVGNSSVTLYSGLDQPTKVRIVNAAGVTMAEFTLEPGTTVTKMLVPGVYIVAGKKVVIH